MRGVEAESEHGLYSQIRRSENDAQRCYTANITLASKFNIVGGWVGMEVAMLHILPMKKRFSAGNHWI